MQAISFKNHLKSHEDGQQSTSGDGFACGDCDEVFDDKNALIIHECAERSYEKCVFFFKQRRFMLNVCLF